MIELFFKMKVLYTLKLQNISSMKFLEFPHCAPTTFTLTELLQ